MRAFGVPGLLRLSIVACTLIVAVGAYIVLRPGGAKITSWELARAATGTELHLGVYVGGCDAFDHVSVKETDSAVFINAYVRTGVRSTCPAIIAFEEEVIRLDSPLSDRVLRGCDPPGSVYGSDRSGSDCGTFIGPE